MLAKQKRIFMSNQIQSVTLLMKTSNNDIKSGENENKQNIQVNYGNESFTSLIDLKDLELEQLVFYYDLNYSYPYIDINVNIDRNIDIKNEHGSENINETDQEILSCLNTNSLISLIITKRMLKEASFFSSQYDDQSNKADLKTLQLKHLPRIFGMLKFKRERSKFLRETLSFSPSNLSKEMVNLIEEYNILKVGIINNENLPETEEILRFMKNLDTWWPDWSSNLILAFYQNKNYDYLDKYKFTEESATKPTGILEMAESESEISDEEASYLEPRTQIYLQVDDEDMSLNLNIGKKKYIKIHNEYERSGNYYEKENVGWLDYDNLNKEISIF